MSAPSEGWDELGEGVFRRRHPAPDLNVGVVVGEGEVLVVDTRSGPAQARDLHAAIRRLTPYPVRHVVNTHFHYDHVLGNAEFLPAEIWAQERCVATMREIGGADIRHVIRRLNRIAVRFPERAGSCDELAADVGAATVVLPTQSISEAALVVVGGRRVELHHLGRGHTDGDLIAVVPDAGVVFAGGLVCGGAEPRFTDAWPLEWPATVLGLLRMGIPATVPGHGAVMSPADVTSQAEQLVDMAHLCTLYLRRGMNEEGVLRRAPFEPPTAIVALQRAKVTMPRAVLADLV